jgi:hypothetical protein
MTKCSSLQSISLALGCAALCLTATLRAGEQVPFKGNFDLVILSSTPVGTTHVRFDADAYIKATQIGNARGRGFFILDLATFAYVGAATWAAANGDEVFLTFVGQFVPTTLPGLFDSVATFEVVGGTGRFAGATGGATVGGQFDAVTQSTPAPLPFEGTISSPGSLKK